MQNSAQSQQSGEKSSWLGTTLAERINRIQKINDPTTSTDEVLRGGKWLVRILLIFTGALGGLSYFRFFSQSFSFELAAFLALALTFTIEYGKNKSLKWAVRIPLFQGWRYIWHLPENSIIWVGCLLIALSTFTMSIYNSTKGGHQLSLMLSQERNHSTFQPNTADIDGQIEKTQASIDNAPKARWKGREYFQEPRAVRAAERTKENLVRQRETTIAQQRADWEADRDQKQGNANFAAKAVLAAGGWVEALQLLFILLIVACEKKLDGRLSPTPGQRTQVNGFQPIGAPKPQEVRNGYFSDRPIGFNLDNTGNVKAAAGVTEDVLMRNTAPPPENYAIDKSTYGIETATVTAIGADQTLKLLRQNLVKEIPNLLDRNANPSTVSGRITRHLDEAHTLMSQPGFRPSRTVGIQVWQYLTETAFPTLNQRGWPYEREHFFVQRLLAAIPAAEGEGGV